MKLFFFGKKITTLFLILISVSSMASDQDIKFTCVTPYPTTSFLAKTKGTHVELTVIHHNGEKFIPIHQGVIVPYDLKLLKTKASIIPKLGNKFTVTWPLSKCESWGQEVHSCFGAGPLKIGDVDVQYAAFYTRKVSTQTMGYNFNHNEVTFFFTIENNNYDITMHYEADACLF